MRRPHLIYDACRDKMEVAILELAATQLTPQCPASVAQRSRSKSNRAAAECDLTLVQLTHGLVEEEKTVLHCGNFSAPTCWRERTSLIRPEHSTNPAVDTVSRSTRIEPSSFKLKVALGIGCRDLAGPFSSGGVGMQ